MVCLLYTSVVVPAKLTVNLPSAPGKTTFQMVQLQPTAEGFTANPVFGKSGMIHLLGHSEGYIVLEAHQEGLEPVSYTHLVEYTEQFDADTIAVYKPVSPGENVIARGDDLRQGETILTRGTWITAKHIAMLAACGVSQVAVYRPVRFAVISTGDEIVDIDVPVQPGQIRDINSYGLDVYKRQIWYIANGF